MFPKQKRLGAFKVLTSSKRDNARFGYTDSFSKIFGKHNQITAFATSGNANPIQMGRSGVHFEPPNKWPSPALSTFNACLALLGPTRTPFRKSLEITTKPQSNCSICDPWEHQTHTNGSGLGSISSPQISGQALR